MWKKSLSAYKKVEDEVEKDNTTQHSFNYQKLTDSETMPKHNKNRKGSSYSHSSTTSTSSSSTCPTSKRYTSTQQSFAFVPPVFPVIPQKFVFFG